MEIIGASMGCCVVTLLFWISAQIGILTTQVRELKELVAKSGEASRTSLPTDGGQPQDAEPSAHDQ